MAERIETDAAGKGADGTTHAPVLVREVVQALRCRSGRTYVDATVGPGGHAEAILLASAPDGRVLGLDVDPDAIARARARLASHGARFSAVQADYRTIREVLADEKRGPVDGIVADLGFSSVQMLSPERGFGFSVPGPLDMRYDRARGTSAERWIATIDEGSLRRVLRKFGEEPNAVRIARAIVRRRESAPIHTTDDLAAIIAAAVPKRGFSRTHPATRAFQAIRIAVNGELEGLEGFVEDAVLSLRRGGRLAVISFHSLEDRIVKHAMRALAMRCVCPPGLPICGCGRENLVRLVNTRPIAPSPEERERNPRSRSAKLRALERL